MGWFSKDTAVPNTNVSEMFEIAGGTVTGRDHRLSGKNNQDAFHWVASERTLVAVIADGCGSCSHSEIGANIGVRLVAETITARLMRMHDAAVSEPAFWERVRQDTLAQLRVLINAMGGSFSQTVNDFFLFTLIGTVITESATVVFAHGDGMFCVNGEVTCIGPFPGNEPPYIAYGLIESSIDPDLLRFQLITLPTEEIKSSLLVGTDGVNELAASAEKNIPGKSEKVGPLSQFWENDKHFANPFNISRRLAIVNGFFVKEPGLLHDDTTLIVVRRR